MSDASPTEKFQLISRRQVAGLVVTSIGYIGGIVMMDGFARAGQMLPAALCGVLHIVSGWGTAELMSRVRHARGAERPKSLFQATATKYGKGRVVAGFAALAVFGASVGVFGAYVHQDLAKRPSTAPANSITLPAR